MLAGARASRPLEYKSILFYKTTSATALLEFSDTSYCERMQKSHEANLNKLVRGMYGRLPHFDTRDNPHAITFRLYDTLPRERLAAWEHECLHLPPRERPAALEDRVQHYLDQGCGHAWLREPAVACVVANAFLYFDHVRYELLAWVVMPNHVHVVIHTLKPHTLPEIVQAMEVIHSEEGKHVAEAYGTLLAGGLL
jgi:hypothetical protein